MHLAEHSPCPCQRYCSGIGSSSCCCHFCFKSRYSPRALLLPLAKGPPPPCPEQLAWLSSGTAVQTQLKVLSRLTHVTLQQHIRTRSWFEEGALVLIFRSVVYMPDKPHFAFAVQECMYSYTSETRAGSPASAESNNSFSSTTATRSGSPHTPDSPHSTCCGVFSGKPESRGTTAAYLPAVPQEKSRADIQGESQGARAAYRGLLFTESTWWVTDGCLSNRTDHQLIPNCNHVLVSSLSKRTFLCLISNHL